MNRIKKTIQHLINDESGQGATEYILLLVVVVAIAMMFKDQIMGIVKGKIGEIGQGISGFTTGG